MAEEQKDRVVLLKWLQLLVLVFGVAGFFIDIGKRSQLLDKTNQDLSELKVIVQDLVKAQIGSSANDATHKVILDDLKLRVMELEKRR
jgi:hypothetical protein